MRHICLAFLLVFLLYGGTAWADGRAFPPDNCSAASPFMAFTALEGSNTFCNSGQDIFHNAIPVCTAGQIVAYDGAKFYCKPPLKCTPRYAATAVKVACGLTSTVMCEAGEFALNGGAIVSNASGQTSAPVYDNSGISVGWTISVLNDGTQVCTINNHVANGTVDGGGSANYVPRFPQGNGFYIYGQAVATCCHY